MPIVFEQVSYGYGGGDEHGPALHDVDLVIGDGEFVGVIGHTGSGKSTLAEHTNGLKVPTSGRVLVDGLPTSDKRARRELRRRVGYVMQYPEYQLFAETVRDDVAFGPRNMGLSDAQVDARVREALDLVGLNYDQVADESPFDLSGGQKRRVAMAGVIAMRPGALTLDEPMAGLDPRGRREVMDILRQLNRRGTTIVMVSHSMEDVAQAASHVVVLSHGSVACQGTPREVFSHAAQLREVGLDVPAPVHIARDLERAGGFDFGEEPPLTLDDLARSVAAQLGYPRQPDVAGEEAGRA